MNSIVVVLTVAGVLGSGLVAGVFFAFSSFVMPALAQLPAAQGIAAMQSINVAAVRVAFMSALFGTAAVCVALIGCAALNWGAPFALPLLVGGVLYLGGAIVLTGAFHVPLNNKLAALDPAASNAALTWADYLRRWTAANHSRFVVPLAASASFSVALLRGA